MKKGRFSILTTLLLIALIDPVQAAAPKAGTKCTKAGITATASGKKFTCIKSGTKLVWNKGVTIKVAPKPTTNPVLKPVDPQPTPISSPAASNKPIPAPTDPREPKNFQDIEDDYQSVAYWAWKKASDKIVNSTSSLNHFEILIGPNSGILNSNPKSATELVSKLYSDFRQPKKNYFVSFSYSDSQWAEKRIEELLDDATLVSQIRKTQNSLQDLRTYWICPSAERCHSSTAMNNRNGTAIILAGFTPLRVNVVTETKGWLQAHEYTHAIQQEQFIGTSRENGGTLNGLIYTSGWMVEGGANFGGNASTYFQSFDQYKKARQDELNSLPRVNQAWLERFLLMSNEELDKLNQGEIYHAGFLVHEIFAALKGPNVQMDLFRLIATGSTFEEAFETVFGATWKATVPVIAKVIASEVAKN